MSPNSPASNNNLNHSSATGPIGRHINLCIYTSFILSCFILGFSLIFLGSYSLWLSEVGIVLLVIHHFIVLFRRSNLKKLSLNASSPSPLPIPVSARKPMIFLAWFIVLIFTVACAIIITLIVLSTRDTRHGSLAVYYIVEAFELIFLIIEIVVVGRIALWSMKERRAVLNASDMRWHHLPQYNRSSCEHLAFQLKVVSSLISLRTNSLDLSSLTMIDAK
jgi:hypothetical protein